MTKDRLLHHVTITVFQKLKDKESDIIAGLDCISPVPIQTILAIEGEQDEERPAMMHHKMPDAELSVEKLTGEDGTIIIRSLFFKRMSWTSAFARRLVLAMTEDQHQKYVNEPELLLDADDKLSVRLDKASLLAGKMLLTESGNCFQVKAAVAAYPKNRERALMTLWRMLER